MSELHPVELGLDRRLVRALPWAELSWRWCYEDGNVVVVVVVTGRDIVIH